MCRPSILAWLTFRHLPPHWSKDRPVLQPCLRRHTSTLVTIAMMTMTMAMQLPGMTGEMVSLQVAYPHDAWTTGQHGT